MILQIVISLPFRGLRQHSRGEQECILSLFWGISYLLFQQGFLPCMSGSAACEGLGKPVSFFFPWLYRMMALHFRCPLFWRWWIFTALLEGQDVDFFFQSQGTTRSNNCCLIPNSLYMSKFRGRVRRTNSSTTSSVVLSPCGYIEIK